MRTSSRMCGLSGRSFARRIRHRLVRLLRDSRATVAIEFAFALPILCLMTFGLYEVTEGVITYMKVVDVANTVADLMGQTTIAAGGVGNSDFDNYYVAAQLVMMPSTGNNLGIAIASSTTTAMAPIPPSPGRFNAGARRRSPTRRASSAASAPRTAARSSCRPAIPSHRRSIISSPARSSSIPRSPSNRATCCRRPTRKEHRARRPTARKAVAEHPYARVNTSLGSPFSDT